LCVRGAGAASARATPTASFRFESAHLPDRAIVKCACAVRYGELRALEFPTSAAAKALDGSSESIVVRARYSRVAPA